MREHIINDDHPMVGIHPLFADKIDAKEEALNDFRSQLSKFKPKQSILELGIVSSKDRDRITAFRETVTDQKLAKKNKIERDETAKEMKKLMESAQAEEDERMI